MTTDETSNLNPILMAGQSQQHTVSSTKDDIFSRKNSSSSKKVPDQIFSIKKFPRLYLNLSRYKGGNFKINK